MKNFLLPLICSFSLFIVSCSNSSGDDNLPQLPLADDFSKMVVAFYPPQGLGDSSDVDNLFSGIFQACNESGGQLEMLEVIPKSWDMGIFTVALYLEVVKSFLESDESAPDFLLLFYEGYLPILEELSEDFEDANITVLLFYRIQHPLFQAGSVYLCAAGRLPHRPRILCSP